MVELGINIEETMNHEDVKTIQMMIIPMKQMTDMTKKFK